MNRVKIFFGILAFAGLSLGVKAQVKTIDSGSCGTSLTWVLTSDSVLTISGSGAMYDYNDYSNFSPWCFSYQSTIKIVVIGDSVTRIGNGAFAGFTVGMNFDLLWYNTFFP